MKNFETLITDRRSTRKFTSERLSPDEVHKILQAALLAPTSKNSRSCEFVAVEDAAVLKHLSECKDTGAAFVAGSALAVAVLCDKTVSGCWIEDASIAAIYMQLQAEDLNIGSCWCQVRGRSMTGEDSEDRVRELLNIPHHYGVLCLIGFGRRGEKRHPCDLSKLAREKVHVEKFNRGDRPLTA
jgi:nitroreductase